MKKIFLLVILLNLNFLNAQSVRMLETSQNRIYNSEILVKDYMIKPVENLFDFALNYGYLRIVSNKNLENNLYINLPSIIENDKLISHEEAKRIKIENIENLIINEGNKNILYGTNAISNGSITVVLKKQ
jgi:hypothetical protein